MNSFVLFEVAATTSSATTDSTSTSSWYSIILMVVMLALMYVMMVVPQKKREKKEKEMRDSLEVGDGVTTIGGIIGRVVRISEDWILLETGADRVKIRVLKNAIAEVKKLESSDDTNKKA